MYRAMELITTRICAKAPGFGLLLIFFIYSKKINTVNLICSVQKFWRQIIIRRLINFLRQILGVFIRSATVVWDITQEIT